MTNYKIEFIMTVGAWVIVTLLVLVTIGLIICGVGDIVSWIQKGRSGSGSCRWGHFGKMTNYIGTARYPMKLKAKDAVRLIVIWFCIIMIGLVVWAVGGVGNWIQKVGRIIYDWLLNRIKLQRDAADSRQG